MTRSAAIYCRISRDRVGAGLGVDRQLTDCQELAARLGWTVAAVHTDNDISAYSGKPRPGYRALLADVEGGRADAVLAWHTDRLHRSPAELETYISVCQAREVPTHCVKAGVLDLSTASGRMTARILGAVARQEIEHSVERIKGQKMHAAKAGRYRGGRRPFGYEADGVTVRPAEAAAVLDASRRVLLGETLSSISREWNVHGPAVSTWHPPLAPVPWTPTAVQRVLRRPRNAALIEVDAALLPARWPAIVPEPVWAQVVALCSDPSRRKARSNERRWLGSGLFHCGRCDDGTTVRSAVTAGHKPGYRCKRSGHLTVKAQPIDELITELVLARLSRPDARLLLAIDRGADTEGLADEAAALRVRNAGLTDLYGDGVITGGELKAQRARIQSRLAELAARMASAAVGSPLAGFADAQDVAAAWDAATVSRRKVIVDALMTVTIDSPGRGAQSLDPSTVRVEWRA
jgi:site-specific DNA recombinase